MNTFEKSRFIVLCGAPHSGKSTAAKFLSEILNIDIIDDAKPIREAAIALYGLTRWHVYTQEGKESYFTLHGITHKVRDLLAGIGHEASEKFGSEFKVTRSLQNQSITKGIVGSCRGKEAEFWKKHGAFVIEIKRPNMNIHSLHDRYDPNLADITINNHGNLKDFKKTLEAFVESQKNS